MRTLRSSFQEFADAIQIAGAEGDFHRLAGRLAERLGFRWFAYLDNRGEVPSILSSYPSEWTRHYLEHGYHKVDPVILRARREDGVFAWDGRGSGGLSNPRRRRFFDEAAVFGVRSGITVPIRAGFGRTAAFTLANDEPLPLGRNASRALLDVTQLAGIYFHVHATVRLPAKARDSRGTIPLTPRERECLGWAARGKTAEEIATIIGVKRRTVYFHLDQARTRLQASSVAHCVAEALQRGWLS